MKQAIKKKKILVAMSGGVDSGVTATLLGDQGYEVSGIFLRLWKNSRAGYAKDKRNLADAQKISKKIGIKLKVIDARKKFRDEVVEYFLASYQKGETPNPCVFCNKNLKFKLLFKEMLKQKADLVATGHYACIKKTKADLYKLFSGRDKNKDQSYFLYTLNQRELSKIIFPLGELTKDEVRKIAIKLHLSIAEKKESQDICFLDEIDTSQFLQKNLKLKKGKIVNDKGEILGRHIGLPLYTLGQRKGIGVGGEGPYFVFGKDFKRSILQVTNSQNEKRLKTQEFYLKNINWIGEAINENKPVFLRTRYHNPLVSAIIKKTNGKIRVILKKPQQNITPGQSAVFYKANGEILGGGIIY